MVMKKEIWLTADGKEFVIKEEALKHEQELKDPDYQLKKEIEDLRKRIEHLEAENLKRVAEIQAARNPYGILNNKDTSSPWMPKVYYASVNNTEDVLDAIDNFFNNPKQGDNK